MTGQIQARNRSELWWLVLLVFAGFFAAVVAEYVSGVYRGRPYPYNTFLFRADDGYDPSPTVVGVHHFSDLQATLRQSADSSPYLDTDVIFPSNYLPFAHLLLKPMTLLSYPHALVLFLVLMTVAVLWLLVAQLRDLAWPLRLLAAGVIGLMNYPILIMLDRGNVEGLILLLLVAAALLAQRGAWTWSAVLIGAAAAMKGYPLLFVLVLVGARRYRDVGVAVVTAFGLTVAGLLTFSGGLSRNIHAMFDTINKYDASSSVDAGVRHGSSLTGFATALAHNHPNLAWVHATIGPVSVGLVLLGAAAVASGRLLLWQSCAVIAGLTILVPSVSYDYRLVLLMVAIVLFLRDPAGLFRLPSAILLGLILVPKGLPILYSEVNIGVVVNPVLVLTLVLGLSFAALRQPLPEAAPAAPAPT